MASERFLWSFTGAAPSRACFSFVSILWSGTLNPDINRTVLFSRLYFSLSPHGCWESFCHLSYWNQIVYQGNDVYKLNKRLSHTCTRFLFWKASTLGGENWAHRLPSFTLTLVVFVVVVLSCVWFFVTPEIVACQAPLSVHGIFQARILEWLLFLPQGIIPTQALNMQLLCLPNWQVNSLLLSHLGSPYTNTIVI